MPVGNSASTPALQVACPAKINLGLFIRGRRPDGYHELETLLWPVHSLQDTLGLTPLPQAPEPELVIRGLQIPGKPDTNLCVRAWRLLKADFPQLPAIRIELDKRIPPGSGLGGGSSNAASTLMGLCELFQLPVQKPHLHRLASQLGADVPFFLYRQGLLATGIGDRLDPLPVELEERLAQYSLQLETPQVHSDTAAAYQNINYEQCHGGQSLLQALLEPVAAWPQLVFNDLEPGVFARYPELEELKQRLYSQGAVYASMTGSGSAVYGLFAKAPA